MAKLGNAEYPETSLTECLRIARLIQTDFGGEVRRSGLAHVLGMSPSGGAFAARLGSMRIWGIIEGRSALRLTSTAGRVVTADADPGEVNRGMTSLVRSVPLFVQLHGRLQSGAIDRGVLGATLQEITEAPMDEVQGRLPQIERLFDEARRYLDAPPSVMGPTTGGQGSVVPASDEARRTVTEQVTPRLIELRFEGGELSLEETSDNIDLLITALVTRKRKLEFEQTSSARCNDTDADTKPDTAFTGQSSPTDTP